MDSNPSTGFKWVVKQDFKKECVMQLDESEQTMSYTRETNMVGVGGTTMLKFKAVGSGCNSDIKLAYVRPFSLDWNNY